MASIQDAMFSSGLPKLVIDHSDIAGSWEQFRLDFSKTLQLKVYCAGKKTVKIKNSSDEEVSAEVDIFDNSAKCLALLVSIGKEGSAVLKSKGVDIHATDAHTKYQYEDLMTHLQNHFEREESIYLQIHNFTHASQLAGEDNREFLKRVESLSRNLDFLKESDAIRETLLKAAVINGLRDTHLSRELMTKDNLTFEKLNTILVNRSKANECSSKLGKSSEVSYLSESRYGSHSNPVSRASSRDRYHSRDRNYSRGRYSDRSRDRYPNRNDSRDRYSNRSQSRDRYSSRNNSRDRYSRSSHYRRGSQSPREKHCYECGSPSHLASACKDRKCYICGSYRHLAKDCNEQKSSDRPRDSRSSRDSDSRSYNSVDRPSRSYRDSNNRDYHNSDRYQSDNSRRRSSSPASWRKPPSPEREKRAERIELRSIADGSKVEEFRPSRREPSPRSSRRSSPTHRRKESPSSSNRRDPSPYPSRGRNTRPSHYIREVRRKHNDISFDYNS